MSRLSELQAKVGQWTDEEARDLGNLPAGHGYDLFDMNRLVLYRRAVRAGYCHEGEGWFSAWAPQTVPTPLADERAALAAVNAIRRMQGVPEIQAEQVAEYVPDDDYYGWM